MSFQAELGQYLRMGRVQALLSREQVAERMRPPVSPRTIASWEVGSRAISVARLADFCEVIGRPVAAVLPSKDDRTQVIHAPRLSRAADPRLRPLAGWAAPYDNELIRFTPEAITQAAALCGVEAAWLKRRLLNLQRR
ncbi:helix-turn-helix domain-containing protein [Amycolatopsis magusensis]|uniref:helix-turn-helix domain-containing protein n=1 Tax=Amycolatopsis magusensis TaxID=882444 RepID=UPI00378DA42F